MAGKDLEGWRTQIDALNEQILKLLNARAECALAVGEIKRAEGLPLYAPDREMAVLDQIRSLNTGPLTHEAVLRIFKQIIDEALRLEEDHANETVPDDSQKEQDL
ncbi:MAG: chorismate mutase [bacterium]|jgi:chorismate mutase-like protein|nr:chorismate mutase [bacterium]